MGGVGGMTGNLKRLFSGSPDPPGLNGGVCWKESAWGGEEVERRDERS